MPIGYFMVHYICYKTFEDFLMITKTLVEVLWNLLLKIVDYLNHRGGHKISLEEGPENI